MHVFLLEDDLALGASLQRVLAEDGFTTEWVRRIQDAKHLSDGCFCCAVIDMRLPDGSGIDLLTQWRRRGLSTPVIIMTAEAGLEYRLNGLNGGADDFIVKPFAPPELIARIRALVRRAAGQSSETWSVGDLCLNPQHHQASIAGQDVALSASEFRLLLTLARHGDAVVSKNALARSLAPFSEDLNFGALDVHICNLRKKVGAARIQTVRGIGFRLQSLPSSATTQPR